MAAALTPRVRVMVACDAIKASPIEDGVFNLRGARNHLSAVSFPFRPGRLWLYLVLSSPRKGRYPGYVQLINEQTGKTIFRVSIDPTFQEGFEILPIPVRLKCLFPQPGRYTVQVWFFQLETPDVLKAEQELSVASEE
jgi:hypothetical protein